MIREKDPADNRPAIELVLYAGVAEGSQEALLLQVLAGLELPGCKVGKQDMERTVGELVAIGLAGSTQTVGGSESSAGSGRKGSGEPIVILHGLSESRLDALLSAIRQTADLKIALKAVVTEQNRNWPFSSLLTELRREHSAVQAYRALTSLVAQAEFWLQNHPDIPPDSLLAAASADLNAIVQRAAMALAAVRQRGEIDIAGLSVIGQELSAMLGRLALLDNMD